MRNNPNDRQKQRQERRKLNELHLICPTCSRELKTEYEIMYGCFLCRQDEKRKPLDIDDIID
jgi:hypothetical protein